MASIPEVHHELHRDASEGVALNLALGIDRDEIIDAMRDLVDRMTSTPGAMSDLWAGMSADFSLIAIGLSDLEPATADPRFDDPAFRTNPLFRQMAQYYLAWCRGLDRWLAGTVLDGMERKRAEFLLTLLKDMLAPVNTLMGNPAAIKTLLDSRGASASQGLRNWLDDLRHNYGYPAVADRSGYVIGKDVATTAGSVVYRDDLLEVIHYLPTTDTVHEVPFLYVFSQVNRFYLGDLTPDRSLFQELLAAGIQVFAVSWRNPTVNERDWSLETYAEGVIKATDVLRDIAASETVNVMGLCAGGITTGTAAALLAARDDHRIGCHSLFVNILDNHPEDSDFGLFVSEQSIAAQKARVESAGIFDEKDVFEMFAWLTPEDSVMRFYRDNYLLGKPPPVHPLLFWSMDYTRVPAGLQCDYLDLAWENRLAKGEQLTAGHRLDLGSIDHDIYIMAGSTDHITPWRGCYRSTRLFGGDVQFVLTNQNHTQTISNKPNRHMKYWMAPELPDDPDAWIGMAEETAGSWREHWIAWLCARSGSRRTAPVEAGNSIWPSQAPAPGRYVLET